MAFHTNSVKERIKRRECILIERYCKYGEKHYDNVMKNSRIFINNIFSLKLRREYKDLRAKNPFFCALIDYFSKKKFCNWKASKKFQVAVCLKIAQYNLYRIFVIPFAINVILCSIRLNHHIPAEIRGKYPVISFKIKEIASLTIIHQRVFYTEYCLH